MSKEITLEELANSVAASSEQKSHQQINFTAAPSNTLKQISSSEISNRLRSANGKESEEREYQNRIEDAPIIANAFESLNNMMNEKQERYEKEFLPKIQENIKEMAFEAELGVDINSVKLDDKDAVIKARKEVGIDDESTLEEEEIDVMRIDLDDNDAVEVAPTAPENIAIAKEPKTEINNITNLSDKITDNSDSQEEESITEFLKEIENEASEMDMNEDVDNETDDEMRERFKKSMNDLHATEKPIEINNFTISRTSISSSKALKSLHENNICKTADWVLYYTRRSMTFKECTGSELDKLRGSINSSNQINNVIKTLQFIYDHVVDNNKPDFEKWCKLIRTEDIESLYFGIYKACYSRTNLLPRECSNKKCEKTSIIKADIDDMIKFDSDETKNDFYNILSRDTTTSEDVFKSQLLQISDDIVISYSMPTLYSTFIQFSAINQKIVTKYQETLNTMAYIDGFYTISRENNTLTPIAIKTYPNNLTKTVIAKLQVYLQILQTLTVDQHNMLMSKLASLTVSDKVSYIYPKQTCPECGATIEEEPLTSILNLVFTRAQLAQVKSL